MASPISFYNATDVTHAADRERCAAPTDNRQFRTTENDNTEQHFFARIPAQTTPAIVATVYSAGQ